MINIIIINMETSWEIPGCGKSHLSAFIWRLEALHSDLVCWFQLSTCQPAVGLIFPPSGFTHTLRQANSALLLSTVWSTAFSKQRKTWWEGMIIIFLSVLNVCLQNYGHIVDEVLWTMKRAGLCILTSLQPLLLQIAASGCGWILFISYMIQVTLW